MLPPGALLYPLRLLSALWLLPDSRLLLIAPVLRLLVLDPWLLIALGLLLLLDMLVLPLLLLSMLLFGPGLLAAALLFGMFLPIALLLVLGAGRDRNPKEQRQNRCAGDSDCFHMCYLHYR